MITQIICFLSLSSQQWVRITEEVSLWLLALQMPLYTASSKLCMAVIDTPLSS